MLGQQKRRCVLNAFPKTGSFGFSLVELMVGIVIMVILVALAMPSFQTLLRNSEIRTAAESVSNGIQRARAEAVARNTNVQFVLGTGSSWTVDYVVKPVPTDPPIDSRASSEGSTNVTVNALAADLITPATTVAFNNLGGVVPNVASLRQVDLTAVGGNQNLRVTIGVGGNAKMCDPTLAPGSSPRAC
jgi:type IV fimbrial biogenesis protein FimT